MYVENYFKGGDYVTLIPVGLPITLQYNISGNLEKVFIGYDSNRKDVSDTFMMSLLSRDYVPGKISITKGTTWVYGILYTNDIPTTISGDLPECLMAAYETKYLHNPEQFRFFAGNIEWRPFAHELHLTVITRLGHIVLGCSVALDSEIGGRNCRNIHVIRRIELDDKRRSSRYH